MSEENAICKVLCSIWTSWLGPGTLSKDWYPTSHGESGRDSRKAGVGGRQWVSVGAQGGSQQQLESHWVLALLQALLPGFWKPPESQRTAVCCLRVWEPSSPCQGLLANCLLTAVEFTLELLYAWKEKPKRPPRIPGAMMQFLKKRRRRRVITGSMETSNSSHQKNPLFPGLSFLFCIYIYTKISRALPISSSHSEISG